MTRIRFIGHHDRVNVLDYTFYGPGSTGLVDPSHVGDLLAMTYEMTPCCGQPRMGPQPMFELADPPGEVEADNKTDRSTQEAMA